MKQRMLITVVALVAVPLAWADAPPEVARFTTEDGVQIVGDYYPHSGGGPAPAVILLHMYRSERSAWKPLVPALSKAGFAVLAIDMRGHGESTEPTSMRLGARAVQQDSTLFNAMHKDVAAAYTWLSQQPNVDLSQFGLVGASVGCSVALAYAARDKSVDGVVCLTPGEKYLGVDSIEDISSVDGRGVMLVATEGERKACDALVNINSNAEVRIVGQGKVHGTRMFGKIKGIEDRIVRFLNRHVRIAEQEPVAASVRGTEYFAIGSKRDIKLEPAERRLFSSVEEARARGLTGPDSPRDGQMLDTTDRLPDSI